MSDGELEHHDTGVVDALPGLARVAAGAWLRTATWGVGTSLRVGTRVARAAVSPDAAVELVQEVRSGMRAYARELLGISDLDERVRQLMPGPVASARSRVTQRGVGRPLPMSLREQGAELLRQSADVNSEDGAHPAYARILSELAPDEGRVLRLIALGGPQPSVDVRAASLIGLGSQLVAQGLNMLGAEAGCRHVDRVPAYLNNLNRLGLIWFSHDPIGDPMRYQVLEAQPEAMEAIKRAGRAKTVHRSVHLTPFGKDFCDVCLPLDTAELEALTGR
jgi:Abortive infection alpha